MTDRRQEFMDRAIAYDLARAAEKAANKTRGNAGRATRRDEFFAARRAERESYQNQDKGLTLRMADGKMVSDQETEQGETASD